MCVSIERFPQFAVVFLAKHSRESPAPFEITPPPLPNILHVELEGKVIGEHLVLTAPPGTPLPFTLKGNTIILGDYHISVRWKGVHDAGHNMAQ